MKEMRQVQVTIKHSHYDWDKQEYVDDGDEVLLGCFHEWENFVDGSHYSKKFAIVELEDGQVKKFEPEQIKFTGYPCGSAMFEGGELTPE